MQSAACGRWRLFSMREKRPIRRVRTGLWPSRRRRFCAGCCAAWRKPRRFPSFSPWSRRRGSASFVAYNFFSGDEHNFLNETAALLITYAIINVGSTLVAIVGKWLIIGRTRPGRYPLWGVYYFRWWLAQRFVSMIHLKWFQATPIMRIILRCLGARIGSDAVVCDFEAGALDLITIGKGATVGGKTQFANAEVIGNELVIGHIDVGDDAYVGTSCVIGHDAVIGEGAELTDLTALPAESRVGAWEIWEGSPARRVGEVDRAALPDAAVASPLRKGVQTLIYAAMLVLLPPITLVPIIPAFYIFDNLSDVFTTLFSVNYLYVLPLLAWPTAMALIAITVLAIALVRWTVLPKVVAGTYSIHSWFYLRKWVVALATELTLETLSSLYATVYMRKLVSVDGSQDRQGCRDFDQFGRALRPDRDRREMLYRR